MKNQKGFTLIELLAAMVVLGIIMGISFPILRALREKNDNKKYELYGQTLVNASKLYVDTYKKDLFAGNETTATIMFKDLYDKNYIKDINVSGISCYSDYTFVKVKKIGSSYEYKYYLGCGSKDASSGNTSNSNGTNQNNGNNNSNSITKVDRDNVTIVFPIDKNQNGPYSPNVDPESTDKNKPQIKNAKIESATSEVPYNSNFVAVSADVSDYETPTENLTVCVSTEKEDCDTSGGNYYTPPSFYRNGNVFIKYTINKKKYDGKEVTVYLNVMDRGGNINTVGLKYQLYKKCSETKITKEADPNVKYGDVNYDDTIDAFDVTLIQKYLVDKVQLNAEQKKRADVNLDGTVDILDSTLIQKYLAEKIHYIPCNVVDKYTDEMC